MAKHQTLPQFELFVMMAIAGLEGDGYGASIRREIEERCGRPVAIGAVYAALGRLESRGLVEHRVSEPLPVRGGRARKYYSVSPAGRKEMARAISQFRGMLAGLPREWAEDTR